LNTGGPEGLPFSDENDFRRSERYVEILTRVMNDEVEFHTMTPQSNQLTEHDPFRVYALAQTGRQYLVFAMEGEPFSLFLGEGDYTDNTWIDVKTGDPHAVSDVSGQGALDITDKGTNNRASWPAPVKFNPPDTDTDWVLVLRTHGVRGSRQADGSSHPVAATPD
jgi:hypothetical protein